MERLATYTNVSLPPEVKDLLTAPESQSVNFDGWYSTPIVNTTPSRISTKELATNGAVDAYALMEPFFDNPTLKGTIRMMDILNGCGRQCDTCLAAAAIPSRMFTTESLERLFAEPKFISMLQPKLRIGSAGDIQDHPDAVKITQMILGAIGDKKIKIITNYRPNDEEKLLGLVDLALKYPEKFDLGISLPFNRTDVINKKFYEFIQGYKEVFDDLDYTPDLFGNEQKERKIMNIHVFDVNKSSEIFNIGRVLSHEASGHRMNSSRVRELNNAAHIYSQRGFVKVQLNPDSLWLMVYTTTKESHTTRLYTPITNENIKLLSQLPWHPDFTTPPNWIGGKGVRNRDKALEEVEHDEQNKIPDKPLDIIE